MGSARVEPGMPRPTPDDLATVDDSPVRCFDPGAAEAMIAEIKAAAKDGDSLGGVIEVLGFGVPVGLGSHVHWDRKLDALLAQAVMSIQAVKGVEIGDGFEVAGRRGSAAHDPIRWDGDANRYRRLSTLAGGTEGGMSTGELLVVRAAMKPLATLNVPTLETVDTATKEAAVSLQGAHRRDGRAGDGRGRRDDGGARARRRGAAQVRRRLGRRVRPQRRGVRGSLDELSVRRSSIDRRRLVLVGMMGTGKTTVGKIVAQRLGRPFFDSDELIEARTGRTVRQIFRDEGEDAFRADRDARCCSMRSRHRCRQ